SPKTAARVVRFRRVVDALHARPTDTLSMLALRQGFADQAHMTREFKAFAGRSPGAYRMERLG
ncbi:MAG: helix-turn-helix domain-containing protein, partial [Gemmatimonadetes bacterium]|nr:helix-turn-helix domain-containing protein [Gemmatimonadota bacterium]NNM32683.1 helix-turn-helix domain-containing protein [Gemmatimonadota bacterium]